RTTGETDRDAGSRVARQGVGYAARRATRASRGDTLSPKASRPSVAVLLPLRRRQRQYVSALGAARSDASSSGGVCCGIARSRSTPAGISTDPVLGSDVGANRCPSSLFRGGAGLRLVWSQPGCTDEF